MRQITKEMNWPNVSPLSWIGTLQYMTPGLKVVTLQKNTETCIPCRSLSHFLQKRYLGNHDNRHGSVFLTEPTIYGVRVVWGNHRKTSCRYFLRKWGLVREGALIRNSKTVVINRGPGTAVYFLKQARSLVAIDKYGDCFGTPKGI